MKFRILSGNHQTRGQVYRVGDVVESRRNLVELYPKRYAAVTTEGAAKPAVQGQKDVPARK